MAIITYEKVELQDRGYPEHRYNIERYERSNKINIRMFDLGTTLFLKMSKEEAEELVTRLQFALWEADNG